MDVMIITLSELIVPRSASTAKTAVTTIVTIVFTFKSAARFSCILFTVCLPFPNPQSGG